MNHVRSTRTAEWATERSNENKVDRSNMQRPNNGCRFGAEYAVGISADNEICVAEITRHRHCANNVIRSQWNSHYAIALIVPVICIEFKPNDFDSRSGARLMTRLQHDDIHRLVGDQNPFVVPRVIFESTLGKINQKEILRPSIRSVGRNGAVVRRDIDCHLPVIVPNT